MRNLELVGLGALNIDCIYRVDRLLDQGETVVNEAGLFPGGSAANTIYALAKLGVKTGYAGVIGDDGEGRRLLVDFQKVGVDISQIRIKQGVRTGSVTYIIEKQGRRAVYVAPGANSLLSIADLDLAYLNRAGWLHLSSFAEEKQMRVMLELIERLEPSIRVSFAPGVLHAVRDLSLIRPILERTHLLFVNRHEMWHLTGKDVIAGAESCLEQGCQIVVVTLGKGTTLQLGSKTINAIAYIRDKKAEYAVESGSQDVITQEDKIGAGDAFAAGFIYGLLKGKGLSECGSLSDIVARFSLSGEAAREGLPTLPEVSQHYRELWHKEL